MKLTWLSDLHLNFVDETQFELTLTDWQGEQPAGYLISGDIGDSTCLQHWLTSIQERVDVPVYFVLGNHDYYHGSIRVVREQIAALTRSNAKLVWLNNQRFVQLTKNTALIGHDSWADGRSGDYWKSDVELNDFLLIDELAFEHGMERLDSMQRLAGEAAAHFEQVLPEVLMQYDNIICVTHVPPFKEATWHRGAISDDMWRPYFTSQCVGEVLHRVMKKHPRKNLLVLCGHTHSSGEVEILPNLRVLTASATYGTPEIQSFIVAS